jgi:hypothetical protein
MTEGGSPAPGCGSAAEAALHDVVTVAGLSAVGASLIRLFGTAVYHLPAAGAVARIAPLVSPAHVTRMATSVQIARWLAACGFPAVEPLPVDQPLTSHQCVITFWKYLPQRGPEPSTADLGYLLRVLHQLPPPPVSLPAYQPLTSVGRAIQTSQAIDDDDRSWLSGHQDRLLAAYARLDFELPAGLIHGDAWRGNLLRDGHRAVLADWDTVRPTSSPPSRPLASASRPLSATPSSRPTVTTSALGPATRSFATSANCPRSPPSSATAPSAPRLATNCRPGSVPSAQGTMSNGRPFDRARVAAHGLGAGMTWG